MRAIYVEKNIPRMLTVKALRDIWPGVVWSPLSPAHVVEIQDPALPGARWLRVRNLQCGICASDLSLLYVKADPGVAPEETGRRSNRKPWLWIGPGFTSARRLLASFGSTRRSALILAVGYLWIGLHLGAEQYRGASAFPVVVEGLSYAVFYPVWVWLATVEAHRLIQAVLDGRAEWAGPRDPGRPD